MSSREVTAFALLPLIIAGIALLPAWVYLAVVWVVGLMAAWELLVILRHRGHPVSFAPTLAALAIGLPAVWYLGLPWGALVPAVMVALLPLAYLLLGGPVEGAGGGIGGSVLVAAYFAVAAGAMGLLRIVFPEPLGWKIVLTTCLIIWGGDSGAYYVGSRFGRHKMAPKVSPKKSWEGIAGGTAATLFGTWFCRTVFFPELSWGVAAVLAALLAVLAPLGDLVESLYKRDAGIKDSSALIPGHGGFLDRTDSLYYVAPYVLALFLLADRLP